MGPGIIFECLESIMKLENMEKNKKELEIVETTIERTDQKIKDNSIMGTGSSFDTFFLYM